MPKQYLDKATAKQADKLAELYLKWLDQVFPNVVSNDSARLSLIAHLKSHSAVCVVTPIIDFVTRLANEAIARFLDRPEHPLFKFGIEAHWRITVQAHGLAEAFDNFDFPLEEPKYDFAECDDEELAWEWKVMETAKEMAKATFGSTDYRAGLAQTSSGFVSFDSYASKLWGLKKIKEGQEEGFVRAMLDIWRGKCDDVGSFEKSYTFKSVACKLTTPLGGRWPESPTLLTFVKDLVEELHRRKQIDVGNGEMALDWKCFERLAAKDCVEHMANVWDKVCLCFHPPFCRVSIAKMNLNFR